MSLLPVSVDVFVSRVLHICSTSIMLGAAVVPFLYKDYTVVHPLVFAVLPVVAVLTGLYNAGAAKPARLQQYAKTYRILVYVVKLACLGLASPVLERFLQDQRSVDIARLALVLAGAVVGSYVRFYRETKLAEVTNK